MKKDVTLRYTNSETKRIYEEQSNVREIQMRFLDPQSATQHKKVMQEIMKTNLRKQSHRSFHRSNKDSAKSFNREYESAKKQKAPVQVAEFSAQKEEKIEVKEQQKKSEQQVIRKIPYKFSFKSFSIEIVIAYIFTFAILYFIQLANFPYFQIIITVAFTASIEPWKSSNLIMLLAIPIIFANYFMNLAFFTYPSIIICYYAVMSFNQKFKMKQLFVLAIIFTIIYGFIILPAIYSSLESKVAYFYIFPILVFILRTVVNYCFWIIGSTNSLFLQLPLFITGLQYGTILSQDINMIQFWYLMVFFTLQIINDRSQFFLRILTNLINAFYRSRKQEAVEKIKRPQISVLSAHANGHTCIHSFHIFLLIYIYAELKLYTAPYTSTDSLLSYTFPWYKPIIVWALSSVYQIMSLILQKDSKDRLFLGYTSNKWWRSVLRGVLLSLGMWIFYLGLGIGALITTKI